MRVRLKVLFFIALLFVLGNRRLLYADDGYFRGMGNTAMPIYHTNIEMVSEVVNITYGEPISVECEFIFKNSGEHETIQMGFPDSPRNPRGRDGQRQTGSIENFITLIDGVSVEVHRKRGIANKDFPKLDEYPNVFAWKVNLAKGEIKRVINKYQFYSNQISNGDISISYILKTGALWKGAIGKADIYFHFNDLDPRFLYKYGIEPREFVVKNNSIEWHFKDFEPEQNIVIPHKERAQRLFESAQKLALTGENPESRSAGLYYLGYAYINSLDNQENAQEAFALLRGKYPSNDFLGPAYYQLHDYEKAIKQYQLLGRSNDLRKKIFSLQQIGHIYNSYLNNYYGAIGAYQAIVNIYEKNGDIKFNHRKLQKGEFIEFFPWEGDYISLGFQAYLSLVEMSAIYLKKLNDPQGSLACERKIINDFPLFAPEAQYNIAIIFKDHLDNYEEGKKNFEIVVQKYPRSYSAYQSCQELLKIYEKEKDYVKAEKVCQDLILSRSQEGINTRDVEELLKQTRLKR